MLHRRRFLLGSAATVAASPAIVRGQNLNSRVQIAGIGCDGKGWSGIITRLGNQIHSHEFYRTAVAAVQSGMIGKVKEVHSWCAATGHGKSFHISRPKKLEDVHKTLAWNLWLGVAPKRPYGGWKIYHPWGWRDWQDFGNGALGDFGCHILDPVFTALKINGAPLELTADHTGLNDEVWPAQTTVKYVFPGTELTSSAKLPITWYDGGRLPSKKGTSLSEDQALPKSGSLFVGKNATLVLPHVGAPSVTSGKDLAKVEGANHYHGWVDGIISGDQPSDGFDYGGPLTEAVLLGNIAVRFRGSKLKWNGKAMEFTNHDVANHWLRRDYRDGWEIA